MTSEIQTPDFVRDTAVTPLGDGRWAGTCSEQWSAPPGPNGGYLAAIVLRAMEAQLDDPARPARSVTLHYLRAPVAGDLEVAVTIERSGRTLTTMTARLSQDGRECILAIAAFASTFPSAADYSTPPPQVPPADEIPAFQPHPDMPAIAHRLEIRHAIGSPPFTGAPEALTGGWLLVHDRPPVDAALLALVCDAWLPAPFSRLTTWGFAPTIDLTIHFRNPDAAIAHDPSQSLLTRFWSSTSADGFCEEDGEVWTPEGVLVAQSRQLALLRPLKETA